MKRRLSLVLAAGLLAGCLVGETTHTIYLSPDGSVVWTVLERDVRSDDGSPESREQEEGRYVVAVRAGEHDAARGLQALGAAGLATRVVRGERPFTVWTEGSFSSADELVRTVLDALRAEGSVAMWTDDAGSHLEVVLPWDQEADDEPDEDVIDLVASADKLRIVLTEGRFTDAVGFSLSDDGSTAVPETADEETARAAGGRVIYALTWPPPR